MRFGVPLGLLHPSLWAEVAVEADRLGFESVWIPEHLVFPADLSGSPYPGDASGRAPVQPDTPLFDAPVFLAALAAQTTRVKLGTYVYLFGLRHPFVSARAFATLDFVSGGRALVGVGAGWLEAEWQAAGLDFASRGRRLDEALDVAKRLWTERVVEHHGEFYDFGPVMFEPKPVAKPHPPVLFGGESAAALRRAVTGGDGWISMPHTLASAEQNLQVLARTRPQERPFEITVSAFELSGPDEVAIWAERGVDRLIVRPWTRGRDALQALRTFAGRHL